MKIFLLSIALVASFIIGKGQSFDTPERTKGWQVDIDTLLSLMKRQHYVYKSKPLPSALIAKANTLKSQIGKYSDERMAGELERLMFYMHDGHSYVLPISTKFPVYYLPLQFYFFEDGVFIINADPPYNKFIGYRVEEMNGVKVDKIIQDMDTFVHQDNPYTVKWIGPTVMRFRGVHEAYGLKANAKEISLRLKKITKDELIDLVETVEFIPATDFRGIPKLIASQLESTGPIPLYLSKVTTSYWIENTPESGRLYFQFNQVDNAPNQSLADFSHELDSLLTKFKPKLFIIDVRHNNGGNKDYLHPLIDVVKSYEVKNADAKIVVITGRNTFSAAQIFISLLDKETNVLFAGEPSSSRPNFVGEEGNMFVLPYSGCMGNISTKYHESIPGDKRKWIQPEFLVLLSSKEYFTNQDPVLEFIKNKFK